MRWAGNFGTSRRAEGAEDTPWNIGLRLTVFRAGEGGGVLGGGMAQWGAGFGGGGFG